MLKLLWMQISVEVLGGEIKRNIPQFLVLTGLMAGIPEEIIYWKSMDATTYELRIISLPTITTLYVCRRVSTKHQACMTYLIYLKLHISISRNLNQLMMERKVIMQL